MLPLLSARLAALNGWRRLVAAAAAGGLAALALPPLHLVPVLMIALPVELWLLGGVRGWRGAFAVGWAFGLGFFAAGLYWIGNAFTVGAPGLVWAAPLIIGGLAAVLALYHGLTALLVHLSGRQGIARVAIFAALWTLFEMARGWLLTGFPWNPLGSVWMPVEGLLQTTAWFGVFGLSLVTAASLAMPAVLGWSTRNGGTWVMVSLCALVMLSIVGSDRVPMGPTAVVNGVVLRLVQPNIPQSLKWRRDLSAEHLQRYLDLSQPAASEGEEGETPSVTHVIWGETALPYSLDGVDQTAEQLIATALAAERIGNRETAIITGAVRRTPVGSAPFQVWNSLVAVDVSGTVRATYDKSHLVPFGEYVPLRGLLPIEKLTAGGTDFSAGPGAVTLDIPGAPPVGPLICYEVIFPGAVANAQTRPEWLLNITNDGWYGLSSGPYQHLATARLRAIEEGLPLVRVANTGISAVFDPYGRTVADIPLGVTGAVNSILPRALPPTLFAQYGNAVPAGLAILVLALGLLLQRRTAA